MQISRPGGDFELVERDIPQPGFKQVLLKVEACGICHSDFFVKEGAFPGIAYPRVPGHEVIGVIETLGEGVTSWQTGQRVGVGWHGGHCFECEPCRRGDFISCQKAHITGISLDGGYAEYMVAPQEALALVPESLKAAEAAPLLCAGITTFNALRHAGAMPGDLVAIQGIGGLGHLGIQYARQMGFKTVAISGGESKRALALDLGAHFYINATTEDPAKALRNMGGARLILATAPDSSLISPLVNGLGVNGKLLVVGADIKPLEVSPMQLISGRKSVAGWPSGTAIESEDTLHFSALSGVKPMIETFPLEKAAEAYQRMMGNEARFRVVLTMN
ncbi:MAG: alcohol dehydrogenase [Microscillaceae bacterium]